MKAGPFVSDIAIFVLKGDVKLELTANYHFFRPECFDINHNLGILQILQVINLS